MRSGRLVKSSILVPPALEVGLGHFVGGPIANS